MFKVEGRYSVNLTERDKIAYDYSEQRRLEHYKRFIMDVDAKTVQDVLEFVTKLMPSCNLIFDSVVKIP